jgi:integrase
MNQQLKAFEQKLMLGWSKHEVENLESTIQKWWQGKVKYLPIISADISGLSIRLYKKKFTLRKQYLTPTNEDNSGVVYLRYRDIMTSKLNTTKLGCLSALNLNLLVESAKKIKSGNHLGIKLLDSTKSQYNSECKTTLKEFLYSSYLDKKRSDNPKTAYASITIIERYFHPFLNKSISTITSDAIRLWMKSRERPLTKRQLAAGESIWDVKPSTMKESICTLRACVQFAKESGVIIDHDLYSLPKIRVDNQIIRYLSNAEEQALFREINDRNETKLKQRVNTIAHRVKRGLPTPQSLSDCCFADNVSPFIILFRETGIRPGTLMNSRWSDIDFESRFFRIRKSIDKRGVDNFIPLNKLAYSILVEWAKHYIHKFSVKYFKKKKDAWIFPSPLDPANQITSIRKSWTNIIKKANIDDFRFYDLRHDFASKIMMKTGNIYMVSQLLNHKQIETTKRYAHLMDKSKVLAVECLDDDRNLETIPSFLR